MWPSTKGLGPNTWGPRLSLPPGPPLRRPPTPDHQYSLPLADPRRTSRTKQHVGQQLYAHAHQTNNPNKKPFTG